MRALFVGLGSIGNRHSKNLRAICEREGIPLHITALRTHKGSLSGTDFPQIDETVTALPAGSHFDVAFITNPTTLHARTFSEVRDAADYFFVEKPVFADLSVTPAEIGMRDDRVYVAAPMRFTAVYRALREEISRRRVFSTRIICSSYLPDWRPTQDYRAVYSAKKELGGGVAIDLVHEIDYMIDLFGFADRYDSFRGRVSHLEIETDDLAVFLCRYKDQVAEVHLDYFGRTYRRTCECFCEEGTLIADFGRSTLTLPSGEVRDFAEDVNARYLREMETFLAFARGEGKNPNPPSLAFEVLRVALGEADNKQRRNRKEELL